MPTILALNGLKVVVYPADHRSAHIHVQSAGFEIVFDLNCPDGPRGLRNIKGKVSDAIIRRVAKRVEPSLSALCGAWRNIHGNYK
jgi:Domain of unknown function (DUF4160)